MPFRLEQFISVYDEFARRAVALFNEKGEVPPMLFGVAMNPELDVQIRIAIQMSTEMVATMMSQPNGVHLVREFTAKMLDSESDLCQQMAKQGVPTVEAVVFVSDAFMAAGMPAPGESTTVSERSDRMECLAVTVTTAERTEVGFCPIETGPPQQCVYRELILIGDDGVVVGNMVRVPRGVAPTNPNLH